MATCLLCSAAVGAHDVVCPHCGGAVDDSDTADPTAVGPPPATTWVEPPPPPGQQAAPTGWEAPGPDGPPSYAEPEPFGPPTGPFGPATGPFGPGATGPPPDPGPSAGAGAPYGPNPYGPPGGAPYGTSPYGPQGAVPYGVPYYVPAVKSPTEGLAVASLVTSIAGLVLAGSCLIPILGCPVGAVMGHMAMRRIDESGKQGRGMALAGAIVGWIGTAILAAGILFIVALVASGDLS